MAKIFTENEKKQTEKVSEVTPSIRSYSTSLSLWNVSQLWASKKWLSINRGLVLGVQKKKKIRWERMPAAWVIWNSRFARKCVYMDLYLFQTTIHQDVLVSLNHCGCWPWSSCTFHDSKIDKLWEMDYLRGRVRWTVLFICFHYGTRCYWCVHYHKSCFFILSKTNWHCWAFSRQGCTIKPGNDYFRPKALPQINISM